MIYVIVFPLSLWVLSRMSGRNSQYTKTSYWWCSIISLLLLVLLAGFRDKGVGTDTNVYIDTYLAAIKEFNSFSGIMSIKNIGLDKAFLALAYLSQKVSDGTFVFFTFIELATLFPLFLGIYNLTKKNGNANMVVLFFFLFLFLKYNYSFNAMRQSCAVGWCFLAFTYYLDKRWIPLIVSFVVAYLFHSSAILFVPLLFSEYLVETNNKDLRRIILGVIVVVLVFSFYNYNELVKTASSFSRDIYGVRYSTTNTRFVGHDRISYSDLGLIVYCFVLIIYSFRHKLLSAKENMFTLILNAIFLFCTSLSLLSKYMDRTSLYPLIIEYWYLSQILCTMKNKPLKYGFYAVTIFYWFYTIIIKNLSETYPYTSKILGI